MDIDQDLEEEMQRHPHKSIEVILLCSNYSEGFQAELDRAGFRTTSCQHAMDGIIYGRIRSADLPRLRKIKGIDALSLDSTQHIL